MRCTRRARKNVNPHHILTGVTYGATYLITGYGLDTRPLVSNLAAWNYFESLDNPTNKKFVADWKAYARSHKQPNADTVVTNDSMEATYVGIT